MKITVILCTYNRCQSLANTLASVAGQNLPQSAEWEVLVVDNNSKDDTREVVDEFCIKYPGRFRYVFEPKQGLSNARNAGIREAQGDIVAFTDDDVTVEPDWLQNLTEPLHAGGWAGSGGLVRPQWSFSPPRWLSLEEGYGAGPLAMFDHGSDACDLNEPPFGANMAFRKPMFEKYGGFRSDLGRCAENLFSNEDTEFGRRLLAGGERLRYVPSAVVYHPVQKDRLQKKYFLAWWFGKGQADLREFGIAPEIKWSVVGIPLILLRRLVMSALRWSIAVGPTRRFSRQLSVWSVAGQILECYRRSPEARKVGRKSDILA